MKEADVKMFEDLTKTSDDDVCFFITNDFSHEGISYFSKNMYYSNVHVYSWVWRCCSARGSSTGLSLVGPSKVNAHDIGQTNGIL